MNQENTNPILIQIEDSSNFRSYTSIHESIFAENLRLSEEPQGTPENIAFRNQLNCSETIADLYSSGGVAQNFNKEVIISENDSQCDEKSREGDNKLNYFGKINEELSARTIISITASSEMWPVPERPFPKCPCLMSTHTLSRATCIKRCL